MDKRTRMHCLLHAPFEGPGIITDWAGKKGHQLGYTRLYNGEPLPVAEGVDLLIIMGGPMNVYDFHVYPWMEDETAWVASLISSGKPVLGICLGAQIITVALEAGVFPGKHKEIGWHNLQFLPSLGNFKICNDLPPTRKVFHWHGDSFDIPEGAVRIASSKAYSNQGYIFRDRVVALQFHLEVTPANVMDMANNCRDELVPGPHIQTQDQILTERIDYKANQQVMFRFLDYLHSFIS